MHDQICNICHRLSLRVEVQHWPNREPLLLCTCHNPECQIAGHTLSQPRYLRLVLLNWLLDSLVAQPAI